MEQETKRTAAIIVTYNSLKHIALCLESVRQQALEIKPKIIVIDNGSSDGTLEFLSEQSEIILVQNFANEGYAKAMNTGIKIAWSEGCDYFLLLNPDVILSGAFLKNIWPDESAGRWGACQGLLLLNKEKNLINSAGNKIHFLGFGYVGDNMLSLNEVKKSWDEKFLKIAYGSGACLLLSRQALEKAGFFDEELFAYHEDLDLGWRLHLQEIPVLLSVNAVAFHDYEEGRHKDKFYLMERNRFFVILKNYRIKTLLLILPALIFTELFILYSALSNGWIKQKLRAYWHILASGHNIIGKRRLAQKSRTASDKEILSIFTYKMNVNLPAFIRLSMKVYYDILISVVSW